MVVEDLRWRLRLRLVCRLDLRRAPRGEDALSALCMAIVVLLLLCCGLRGGCRAANLCRRWHADACVPRPATGIVVVRRVQQALPVGL